MLQAAMLQHENYRLMDAISRRWRDYSAAEFRPGPAERGRARNPRLTCLNARHLR